MAIGNSALYEGNGGPRGALVEQCTHLRLEFDSAGGDRGEGERRAVLISRFGEIVDVVPAKGLERNKSTSQTRYFGCMHAQR